ncbi:SRPBCC family protein [Persicimonas caeni]|uniref:SRPBCC family protein n=1 Tax=Persicimonas caeni TaxID=2292766 RepID=A0A4Y6PYI4_PERCE|nr:SRPBCC family protein [Persicimonas caeni]QDG53313.1 SRPBCC family protein [Persicimonas caeni]QED34535.1 SRPBCC family protein [Persicimonas caeni]
MSERTHGRETPASNLRPRSRAHRRELEVQRDNLSSYSQRPEREGIDQIDNPAMLVGGGVLALWGIKHWRSMFGLLAAGVGSGLVYQGLKQNQLLDGHNLKQKLLNTGASQSTQVRATITIDKPVEEVYAKWKDLSNLSRCMRHVESVRRIDDKHWHWKARAPKTNITVEWDSEIIEEQENEMIVWRSVKGSEIHNEGMIEFKSRPNAEGTEIHAHIVYYPPAGKVGKTIANFLHGISDQIVKEDLRRFKRLLETGEVPTIEGQTSGRRESSRPALPPRQSSERPRPSL